MAHSGTIEELTSLRNPTLDLSREPAGSVTQDHLYLKVKPNNVSRWDDFNYANIAAAYGHLFKLGPFESDASNLRGTPARVEREDHVDFVTAAWCMQICRMPIKHGAGVLQRALGLPEVEVTTQAKGRQSRDLGSEKRARIPDWSVYLKDDAQTVLVWGDDKCSSKWTSDQLKCPDENYIWPFRQMLTYCVNNNTRYGFVLTPKEMVVMRVLRDSSTRAKPQWMIQYKSVPWDEFGPGQLTVNLAIWAIAMMSVNEGYRMIHGPEWTLPLNVWWKDVDRKGVVFYEHHLSGFKITAKPRGADIRSRPTTVPRAEPAEPQLTKRRRTSTRPSSRR